MKVGGPSNLRAANARRRASGGDAPASGEFAAHMGKTAESKGAAVAGTTQIGSVEALLALQGGGDATRGGPKAEIERAEDLLDRLDQIRVGILTGGLSRGTLDSIVARLEARRREGVEPRLAAIIDEIELRAKVELAKLSMI
ncbi:MAG: flagellar assembly protein FliX [Alphaproteobacteria bacterium]|nr:flagellar assembly protein FliX [Alphaproteobacteria bacterium]